MRSKTFWYTVQPDHVLHGNCSYMQDKWQQVWNQDNFLDDKSSKRKVLVALRIPKIKVTPVKGCTDEIMVTLFKNISKADLKEQHNYLVVTTILRIRSPQNSIRRFFQLFLLIQNFC